MTRLNMLSRFGILCLSLVMMIGFGGCKNEEQPADESTPVTTDGPFEMPSEYTDGEYANNPHATTAVASGNNTVRVLFSQPVKPGAGNFLSQIQYTSSDGQTGKASAYRMYGYSKDRDGVTYATVFEFDFKQTVSGGQITFTEQSGDGDRAMSTVLCAYGKAGLYAEQEGKTELALTDQTIELPQEQVYLVGAQMIDQSRGRVRMTFSVPVRSVTDFTWCTFICDSANPNPGVGGSWQYTFKSAKPVDPEKGKDGMVYAKTWELVISATAAELKSLASEGVVRISENDSGAGAEYASATDNFHCGRVVVAIDGRPLLADFIRGWDVAATPYEN